MEGVIDSSSFVEELSRILRENGLSWVDDSVRDAILEGGEIDSKEAMSVDISDARRRGDFSEYVQDSADLSVMFETKRTRRTMVTITRPFTTDEIVNLYLSAIYSTLVEPQQLSIAGLDLLGREVDGVTFESDDPRERFEVQRVMGEPTQIEAILKLANLLEGVVIDAP